MSRDWMQGQVAKPLSTLGRLLQIGSLCKPVSRTEAHMPWGPGSPVEFTDTCCLARYKEARYLSCKGLFVLRRHGRGTKVRQGTNKRGHWVCFIANIPRTNPTFPTSQLIWEVTFSFLPWHNYRLTEFHLCLHLCSSSSLSPRISAVDSANLCWLSVLCFPWETTKEAENLTRPRSICRVTHNLEKVRRAMREKAMPRQAITHCAILSFLKLSCVSPLLASGYKHHTYTVCTAFKGSHPNWGRQEVTTKHGSPMIKLFKGYYCSKGITGTETWPSGRRERSESRNLGKALS